MRWNAQLRFFFILLFFSTVTQAVTQSYQLDNQHSYVAWRASHFGFSHPSGKWMVQGKVNLDSAKPQNSQVNATIQIASLVTGVKELDEHLMGPLFFNLKKYPEATFVSDQVQLTGKNTAKVSGILMVHGIQKHINLMITLNKIGVNPVTNKKTLGFSGETTLKRSDFGITTLLPGIGDEIRITIEAEAFRSGEDIK